MYTFYINYMVIQQYLKQLEIGQADRQTDSHAVDQIEFIKKKNLQLCWEELKYRITYKSISDLQSLMEMHSKIS